MTDSNYITNKIQLALRAFLRQALDPNVSGIPTAQIYSGIEHPLVDDTVTPIPTRKLPCVECISQTAETVDEHFLNWLTQAKVVIRTNADDTTESQHHDMAAIVFNALTTDTIHIDLTNAAEDLTVFLVNFRSQNWELIERSWQSELLFDIHCCGSRIPDVGDEEESPLPETSGDLSGIRTISAVTIDDTQTELLVGGAGGSHLVVPTDTTWVFSILLVCRTASGSPSGAWKMEGAIHNNGGTVALVPNWDATNPLHSTSGKFNPAIAQAPVITKTVLAGDTSNTFGNPQVDADTDNASLRIRVTAANYESGEFHWFARVEVAQVAFAEQSIMDDQNILSEAGEGLTTESGELLTIE